MAITQTVRTTTDSVSFANSYVGVKLAPAVSFVEVSEFSQVVVSGTQERDTSESKWFQGGAIVATSSLGTIEVTVTGMFTEDTGGFFYNVWTEHQTNANGGVCDVQWARRDATAGDFMFETTGGKIKSVTIPEANAETATPATFELVIEASTVNVTEQ